MIYCLYGTEKILIDEFIEKEINNKNISNISRYNLEDYSIIDVLNDASYMDLFSEDKAIIVEFKDFFSNENEKEIESFTKYINNPNERTHLFLIINSESLDERRKIVKLLREKCRVLEFNKLKNNDIYKFIKSSFENDGYKIDSNAVNLLINNIGNNTSLIYTEIEKLKIYKIDEKIISEDDIRKVVKKQSETDVFKLVDAVLNNNKSKMLSCYKDLIECGEEEFKLVILLAGEFRLLYQVKILLSEGLRGDEITKKIGVNPYRVTLAINRVSKYSEKKLLDQILNLSKIDYGIKTGEIVKENALLNFFLEL